INIRFSYVHGSGEIQSPSSEPITKISKHEGPENRASQIRAARESDFKIGETESVVAFELSAHHSDSCHFETIEHPRDSESHREEPVIPAEWQSVQPVINLYYYLLCRMIYYL